MNMKVCLILFNILLMLAFPVSASYAGDRPLETVVHDEHPGELVFSIGDSGYSGELRPGDRYTVNFELEPPAGGKIKFARAYVYWVWSKNELEGIYPEIDVTLFRGNNFSVLPLAERYSDTKGFVSRYDFFSGMDAYTLDQDISKPDTYSITLRNSAEDGSTFCVQGIGLLQVYEAEGLPEIEYWINEGCDMLYAEYGISPDAATMTTYFKGDVDPEKISAARLITVSPSGGYTSGTEARNRLFFNEKTKPVPVIGEIIRLLFGGGGVWKNVYLTNESVQVAWDEREILDFLEVSGNYASIQDNGDYLLATNAALVLTKKIGTD